MRIRCKIPFELWQGLESSICRAQVHASVRKAALAEEASLQRLTEGRQLRATFERRFYADLAKQLKSQDSSDKYQR
eukprot:COSAG01_NODE_1834_length_9105_cov_35.595603_5_plen_76_part_00